jgi:hypothetical protein
MPLAAAASSDFDGLPIAIFSHGVKRLSRYFVSLRNAKRILFLIRSFKISNQQWPSAWF